MSVTLKKIIFLFQQLRGRLIVMAFNWIVATLCFYGLSLNAGIGSNVFSAFSLSAAMEIPAYIFSALVRYHASNHKYCNLYTKLV